MRNLKKDLYDIIFGHESKAGKAFDIWLIIFVSLSVLVVMLESVDWLNIHYNNLFYNLEWFFTIFFSVELALRLFCVEKRIKYIFSLYGIIDILAILPSYLGAFLPGAQSFLILRALRLLRIFRILKLHHYTKAGQGLYTALAAARPKIIIFLTFVTTFVIIVGAVMYLVEGRESGFTSIPKSIYWAVVTMTTVGYGDITPQTILGQFLSSILMIVGYGVIAVPTGIVSVEMARSENSKVCLDCGHRGDNFSNYCSSCGEKFSTEDDDLS